MRNSFGALSIYFEALLQAFIVLLCLGVAGFVTWRALSNMSWGWVTGAVISAVLWLLLLPLLSGDLGCMEGHIRWAHNSKGPSQ